MRVLHLYFHNHCSAAPVSQVIFIHQRSSVPSSLINDLSSLNLKVRRLKSFKSHPSYTPVGPSLSNNAQGRIISAPALAGFPAPPLAEKSLADSMSPGVTKFTSIPSSFNSFANEIVYELRAALPNCSYRQKIRYSYQGSRMDRAPIS